jgi:hypothetical protein
MFVVVVLNLRIIDGGGGGAIVKVDRKGNVFWKEDSKSELR